MDEKTGKRRNVVSTIISDKAQKKLNDMCKELDRPKSWVIAHLILEADVEHFREIFANDD